MRLKQILADVLSATPSYHCTKEFVSLCHGMASAYLRQKAKRGKVNLPALALSSEDLAWDSLADLFQRDGRGVFVKLASYFCALDWENKNEDDLLFAARRLIFSLVNQAVYRNYRDADPSLGKILRNLKHAVAGSPLLTLTSCRGELWLSMQAADGFSSALPVMPPEILEAYLTAAVRGEPDMKQVLHLLSEILESQREYRPAFPLTGLALIIRSAFVHLHAALEQESSSHDHFASEEIQEMISKSLARIKREKLSSYVGKQKIDAAIYETYFSAMRDLLGAEFVDNDGFGRSYYDHLRQYLSAMTREDYERHYRCQFEYLAKLARQAFLDRLKRGE
jgi:hypothetical protein